MAEIEGISLGRLEPAASAGQEPGGARERGKGKSLPRTRRLPASRDGGEKKDDAGVAPGAAADQHQVDSLA